MQYFGNFELRYNASRKPRLGIIQNNGQIATCLNGHQPYLPIFRVRD